jgi:hypothetical protein
MGKIMSRTNNTSNIATHEHHHALADGELDAVTGGIKCTGGSPSGPVTFRELAKVLGELKQAQFNNVR